MKLIIAGGRNINFSYHGMDDILRNTLYNKFEEITEIVSGGAKGIDSCGEVIAEMYDIPLKIFKADWDKHGKAAGPIRNREMAKYADILLLIWDGQSRGSANMKSEMKKLNKPIYEVIIKKEE